jgi:hypothetical protein
VERRGARCQTKSLLSREKRVDSDRHRLIEVPFYFYRIQGLLRPELLIGLQSGTECVNTQQAEQSRTESIPGIVLGIETNME